MRIIKFPAGIDYGGEAGAQSYIPKPVIDILGNPDFVKFVIKGKRVELQSGGTLPKHSRAVLDFVTRHPGCDSRAILASVKLDRNSFKDAVRELFALRLIDVGDITPMRVYRGKKEPPTFYPAVY